LVDSLCLIHPTFFNMGGGGIFTKQKSMNSEDQIAVTLIDNGLPEGWESSPLKTLATLRKGKKPNRLDETFCPGAVPYIDIEAFERGNIQRYADPESSTLVDKGEIIVVWDGARCGHVGKAPKNGALGSTLGIIEPILIHPDYILRILQLSYDTINTNPRGIGIPHVEPELFWNLEVPLAPLAEQNRIMAKVEGLFERVKATKERLAKVSLILKHFRQAVLAAACSGRLTATWRDANPNVEPASVILQNIEGYKRTHIEKGHPYGKKTNRKIGFKEFPETDLNELPNLWIWSTLNDLTEEIGDVDHKMPKATRSGIPYVSTKDFTEHDAIDFENAKRIAKEDYLRLCRKIKPEKGDLLLSRYGTVGEVRLVKTDQTFQASYSIAILKSLKNVNLSTYLLLVLRSPVAQDQIQRDIRASAQPDLGLDHIRRFIIPLPPLSEVHEIARRVESMFKLADAVEKRVAAATARAEKLTQAILAKAFRGELVPTEADLARRERRSYEPASKLLARIKSDKEMNEISLKLHHKLDHKKRSKPR